MFSVKVNLGDIVPTGEVLARAAGRGVENLVVQHLRDRNESRSPSRYGLPKSNYWADAAKDVSTEVSGSVATVSVEKEGAALHYEGGTVRPKKKALAIPIDPSVALIWPSEYVGSGHRLFKTPAGALGDADTGKILYILLSSVTLRPDPSVLPDDGEIYQAAESAIMEALS